MLMDDADCLTAFVHVFPPPAAQEPLPCQVEFTQDTVVRQIVQFLEADIDGHQGEWKTCGDGDAILLLGAQAFSDGRPYVEARVSRGKAAGRGPSASEAFGPLAGEKVTLVGVFGADRSVDDDIPVCGLAGGGLNQCL